MKQLFNPKVSLALCAAIVLISYSGNTIVYTIAAVLVFVVVLLDLLEHFILKDSTPNNIQKQLMNREMLISLAAYWLLSKVNPDLDNKIEFLFWGFFIVEIALQFFLVKKFKRPLQFRPMSVYISNHIMNLSFAIAILTPLSMSVFYVVFGLVFLANIESLAIVYTLPFWKDGIRWIGDALKVKSDYEKYLRR